MPIATDPKTIGKIEQIQQKMADLVHSTPALVAQQLDGIGWTSPVDPSVTPTAGLSLAAMQLTQLTQAMAGFGTDPRGPLLVSHDPLSGQEHQVTLTTPLGTLHQRS
jgi:hypothetical protein